MGVVWAELLPGPEGTWLRAPGVETSESSVIKLSGCDVGGAFAVIV